MTLRTGEDMSFEGGSSRSHYVEESFWRRLWTCRQTEYCMNEHGDSYYRGNERSISKDAVNFLSN
jgi:hypothetical protein